jgi:hypothetical protein
VLLTTLALSAALSAASPCASPADRCSCLPPPPPREALAQADAVFAGRVVSVVRHEAEDPGHPGGPHLEVRIVPTRRWKAAAADTVTVRTATDSAACGFPFQEGEEYLVYAGGEDALRVVTCSRTARLADAADDVAALGAAPGPRIPVRKDVR